MTSRIAALAAVLVFATTAVAMAATHSFGGYVKARPGEKMGFKVKDNGRGKPAKITDLKVKKWSSSCNDEIRDTTKAGKKVSASLGSFTLSPKKGGLYTVTEKTARAGGVKFEVSLSVQGKNASKAIGRIVYGYRESEDVLCAGGGDVKAKVK